ncbi:MAG: hypothetical protein ACR2ME_07440, partial [Acidimicrobiia bacterium]
GSGKSSLFNAISATELAEPGAKRPTTAKPLVLVPSDQESRLANLWDELGIAQVEAAPDNLEFGDLGFVLIDLPDVDSLDPSHRQQVDELLSDLDLVVWVTDPEKYRDRVLHDQFLRPLAGHAGRFLFVLNQIDRLRASELEEVLSDLASALRHDGFADPSVWPVAADPPIGPPLGIDELRAGIRAAGSERSARRVRVEIGRLLRLIDRDLAPVDFDRRWDKVRKDAARRWPAGRDEILEFVEALKADAPEVSTIEPLAVIGAVTATTREEIARHLDQTLGRSLREKLRPRALSKAIAAELQLALAEPS